MLFFFALIPQSTSGHFTGPQCFRFSILVIFHSLLHLICGVLLPQEKKKRPNPRPNLKRCAVPYTIQLPSVSTHLTLGERSNDVCGRFYAAYGAAYKKLLSCLCSSVSKLPSARVFASRFAVWKRAPGWIPFRTTQTSKKEKKQLLKTTKSVANCFLTLSCGSCENCNICTTLSFFSLPHTHTHTHRNSFCCIFSPSRLFFFVCEWWCIKFCSFTCHLYGRILFQSFLHTLSAPVGSASIGGLHIFFLGLAVFMQERSEAWDFISLPRPGCLPACLCPPWWWWWKVKSPWIKQTSKG